MSTVELPMSQQSDVRENIAGLHALRFDWQRLCERATGLKPYIVFSDELQLHIDGSGDWQACVVSGLDTLIEKSLPELYENQRPAMCLNADYLGGIPSKAGREGVALGLIMHEMTHLAESEVRRKAIPELTPAKVREILEARSTAFSETPGLSDIIAPWHGHGVEFCRLLLHIHGRFLRAGMPEVNDDIAWPHDLFELSPLNHYRKLLRLELSKRPTVAEIVNSPPPARFAAAFAEDGAIFWARMKREAAR